MEKINIKLSVPKHDQKELKIVKKGYIDFLYQARDFLEKHCDHYTVAFKDCEEFGETKEQVHEEYFGEKGCFSDEEGIMCEFHQDVFDGGSYRMRAISRFFESAKVSSKVKEYAWYRFGCFTNHST